MLRAADHRDVGRRDARGGRPKPRTERGKTPFRASQLGGVEQLPVRGTDQRVLDPLECLGIRGREQQVDAGTDGRDDIDRLVRALGECPHVERVGDRHALEPEVPPEQVGHHGPRQRRRQVRPTAHRRQREVAGHRHLCPGREGGTERRELATLEHVPRSGHGGATVMRVGRCLAGARCVLDGGGDAGRLEAADHRHAVPSNDRRVVAERPDAERRIGRVRRDVEHRRVDDVDAHRPRLETDRPPDPLGQLDVVDGAERHVAGERRRAVAERDELPALLVRGDEQRAARAARRRLDARRQRPHLLRRPNVQVPEQRHARRRRRRQSIGDPPRQHLALEREHHPPEDRVGHPLTAPDRPRTK